MNNKIVEQMIKIKILLMRKSAVGLSCTSTSKGPPNMSDSSKLNVEIDI